MNRPVPKMQGGYIMIITLMRTLNTNRGVSMPIISFTFITERILIIMEIAD